MWIATKVGFISVVKRPASTIAVNDRRELQIRARDRKTLNQLRNQYMPDTLSKIVIIPRSDYQFRAYCTHEDFALVMARLVFDINYTNFKDAVPDDDLHNLYLRIWMAVMRHYEIIKPRRKGIK